MPAENLEEQGLSKNPRLELAQFRFILSKPEFKDNGSIKKQLLDAITEDNMAPFYESVCNDLGWDIDTTLLQKMKTKNEEDIKKLESNIEDAEQNLGESEVREALTAKAEYICKIGDKEGALTAFQKAGDKTVTLGLKLDLCFHLIRIGLFYMDHDLINQQVEKATSLIEEGGDWDRRNRLKVYKAVYKMSIRDFPNAAKLFLDAVATFTSYELMDYKQFVTYTILCSVIALDRPDLREKVIKGSEIQEVLHSLPDVKDFLSSLYECRYDDFFKCLLYAQQMMLNDRLLSSHAHYYVREMRIKAYSQLLESYRSLTLKYMSDAFGVGEDFIDRELSRFISQGRLHCKIDKANGIVETNRPDSKNWQYQATIKQGDILLNRMQKLSRVINI
ncbi:DgyrCDS2412 [Dimorphilus gyrociliatus]|uniref:26S proteasome non-ATPase regulatory subunit 6 n=1 Tax=Dimorphilus gyrociliatus TaxID=2664684 RepID=A0A7I8VDB0_9ANNE|nr:DgyrCDS2412 [Dimorphilus gyrociliatus]